MSVIQPNRTPWWSWVWPAVALVVLALQVAHWTSIVFSAVEAFALIATVFAAVHHAEVVALRVGEPLGSLVLAFAVTIIEVALIVSVMIAGGPETATLARDTIFAVVMIVCNGIIGICLLAGGLRHHEQEFQLWGANAALTVLIALTTLTLVLPNVTRATPGPTFSAPQLAFEATVSFVLYLAFLFVQNVRHRSYFLAGGRDQEEGHSDLPPNKVVLISACLLLVSLVLVVGMAKALTPTVERGIEAAGAPRGVVGIIIAGLVLLPEGLASYRAATANRLQTSINLALGSALASIGLTIPAVAGISLALSRPLTLGLSPEEEVLLALTLVVSILSLGTGRTTVLQGAVHLILFAVFLFLAVVP